MLLDIVVDEDIFSFVWQGFFFIRNMLDSIKISYGGFTVTLLQFSLGIIVFGVLFGLFINYTKKQSASDVSSAYEKWHKNKDKGQGD